jgi:hypothetical protein
MCVLTQFVVSRPDHDPIFNLVSISSVKSGGQKLNLSLGSYFKCGNRGLELALI